MTSKLTRQEMLVRSQENVKALRLASRQHAFESARNEILADLQIAEYALSCLEIEPVADVVEWHHPTEERTCDIRWRRHDVCPGPLYTSPQPAPVVPDKLSYVDACNFVLINGMAKENRATLAMRTWNACRAAMLSHSPYAGNKVNSPEIPKGFVLVPREPTDEMIAAAMDCDDVLFNSDETFCVQFGNIYKAMIAAAPQEVSRNIKK